MGGTRSSMPVYAPPLAKDPPDSRARMGALLFLFNRVRVRACVCVCECVRVYINEFVFPCPFLGRRLSWACPSLCYDPPWSSVSTKLTLDTLFPDQTHLGHSNIVQQSGCSSSFRLDLWVALTIHHPLVAYDNLKHTADSPGIS